MKSGPADKYSAEPIVAQYETLRLAGLAEPLPPEARSGLVVFLRRGMWAWARTLLAASAPQQPARPPSSNSRAPHQEKAIIQVFAALALNSESGRAQ